MNLTKLLRLLLTLLNLRLWLRRARQALTALSLALCAVGAAGWLLQRKRGKKALKRAIGRVIG